MVQDFFHPQYLWQFQCLSCWVVALLKPRLCNVEAGDVLPTEVYRTQMICKHRKRTRLEMSILKTHEISWLFTRNSLVQVGHTTHQHPQQAWDFNFAPRHDTARGSDGRKGLLCNHHLLTQHDSVDWFFTKFTNDLWNFSRKTPM